MALSLPLQETEAPSARERKGMLEKGSKSKVTKTVEEPASPPPIPATALMPGGIGHKVNLLSPSSGARSLFLVVLTLIVYQRSRKWLLSCPQAENVLNSDAGKSRLLGITNPSFSLMPVSKIPSAVDNRT